MTVHWNFLHIFEGQTLDQLKDQIDKLTHNNEEAGKLPIPWQSLMGFSTWPSEEKELRLPVCGEY